MNKTNPNDAAFARPAGSADSSHADWNYAADGLTKREYFAALALQGLLADPNIMNVTKAAALAIQAADDLVAALNGTLEAQNDSHTHTS